MVSKSLERDGKGVQPRAASTRDPMRLPANTGRASESRLLAQGWQEGLSRLAAGAVCLVIFAAIIATALTLLWIILDFMISVFMGVIILVALIIVLGVLTR